MSANYLEEALAHPFAETDFDFLGPRTQGKVRDIYDAGARKILITTDRLSAFDHILGLVPCKGEVLNQLAAFWFEQCGDIVPNHRIALPDPNVLIAHSCQTLPVEVVVRGYISGVTSTSLWTRYQRGERTIYGIRFAEGLSKNDRLPEPVITPTTKAAAGEHDERITEQQIVEQGLVTPQLWAQIRSAALALFERGTQIARQGGLILVDTKYEFGLLADGRLALIDEAHTPDSSRFWIAESYDQRRAAGQEPENLDKEFVRLAYAAEGYSGDGAPPPLSETLAVQAAARYIQAYEMLTGMPFNPAPRPAAPRIAANLRTWLQNN